MTRALTSLLTTALLAQEPSSFSAQSRLVIASVSVTDSKGRPVDGLEPSDFEVFDNGKRREASVDTIATGVAPIALIVAVQTSGISGAALDKVRKIGSMVQPLITGERGCAGLVGFDEQVRWLQSCTSDADGITRAFAQLRIGEEKAGRLLDAVHEATQALYQIPNVRRVLLVVSESRDRGSESDLPTVVAEAQSAGVMIYAATYSAFKTAFTTRRPPGLDDKPNHPSTSKVPIPPPSQRVDLLGGFGELLRLGKVKDTEVLSVESGGELFSFATQSGLERTIEKFAGTLHSEYVISFIPERDASGFHTLEVKVKGRAGLKVRTRPGYWASSAVAAR